MKKEKLLSVIIPVYGVEKYIGQCLESIINQTYKNLEIIVINDGTRDKSAVIAKEYATKDTRIKVYDYENGGLSMARNRGLDHANGEYISILDSDDWFSCNMLKDMANVLEKTGADMAKCGVIETDGKEERASCFPKDELHDADFYLYYGGFLRTIVCNGLYKRELAMKVRFPENVVFEDNYASGMYVHYAKKIAYIKKAYYYYRVNMTGISKGIKKRPLDRFRAVYRLKQDLNKDGFADKRLDQIMAREIYHYIRDKSPLVRVRSIEKEMKDFVIENLDLRRKVQFYILCVKNNI